MKPWLAIAVFWLAAGLGCDGKAQPAQPTPVLPSNLQSGPRPASAMPDFHLPALTQKQMYEDYDAFTNIVQQVFPLTEVNRQIYGIDVGRLLAVHREQIATLSGTEAFVELVNRTMVACRGSHFWITCPRKSDYYRSFVSEGAYDLAAKYHAFVTQATQGSGVALPILYFKGEYYTACDFTCGGLRYPQGLKVLACGEETPDALVSALTQSGVPLSWDYDLKKFYTPGFYKYASAPAPPGTGSSVQVQLQRADGAMVNLDLRPDRKASWKMPRTDRQPLVALVHANILYIRLPGMNPEFIDFYRKELLAGRHKPIQKVVIDIRNNGGGSDNVWSSLLSLLLDKAVAYSTKMAARNSAINREYLARHPSGKMLLKSGKVQKISFLGGEEFLVLESTGSLLPAPDSLRLRCKIYVLSDHVYSSAGSLMNACRYSERLVSVGLPNSMILGRGIDPFAFSLPNSKLAFSLEPELDLTGAQSARDAHHNDVEVRITPTLEQLLDCYNTGTDMPLEQRLTRHDPFFQKVLELE